MSFLSEQQQSPEFLNNYLKYNKYILFNANTSVEESFFDLRTFFRYIKAKNSTQYNIHELSIEEFKKISIKDVTVEQLNKVNIQTIHDFIFFLRNTMDNNPNTRNRKLNSIKRLFEYLSNNNLIAYNPTSDISGATVGKRQPKYLNLEESKTLLSKTINSDQRFKIRNYAITCLFLNCSIRLSELVGINLTDFKLDEMTLKIRGKGNKERLIYLNDATCEAIEEYLKVRPNLTKENPYYKALFISGQNKRISKRSVQNIIDEEMRMLFEEDKKGYHTHTLRHTGATLMYNENNTDIFVIKKILGHKSISATEIYTHVSPKKLKELMENCTISSILENKEAISNGRM